MAIDGSQNDVFCQFKCFNNGLVEVPCPPTQAEGYGEYYDMIHDPYQTRNTMPLLPNPEDYISRLQALQACSGQVQCNAAPTRT